MNKDLIRSSKPYFPKEDIDLILEDIGSVLEEGRLRNGRNLQMFEQMFAEYIGTKEAIAFDSDGDALETALRYHGAEDHEVVVCTNSFISIPNSVVYAGGKVVFADIRAETLSMDPRSLKKCVSHRTRGVVVTHIAGFPNPDLKEIIQICQENDFLLIEDATHAAGAMIGQQKVGTFGEAAVFAFTPTKVLTSGEGGMLVTNNPRLSEEAKRSRYYGSGPGKTDFVNLGRHMMLPEVSAVLGVYQLKRAEEFIAKRNKIADIYNRELERLSLAKTVKCPSDSRCSYYKYPLILDPRVDRAKFTELLEKDSRVETGNVFYPPCHLQPVYQKMHLRTEGNSLPVSEKILRQTITLPMHAAMNENDASKVVESVNTVLDKCLK
jgi:dTDP-4-amino-4,6-dideoxygalactose transaminase